MPKHPARLLGTALVVAWSFDLLFWGKTVGISFPIFVTLCLVGGSFLAWKEGRLPARRSLLLLAPLAFFAIMAFLRLESMSLFLSIVLTLALMALLANTWQGGRWLVYSLGDYVLAFLRVIAAALYQPLGFLPMLRPARPGPDTPARVPAEGQWKRAVPVVRGLLIAAPVIVVFASLLASADQVFSQTLGDFFKLFDISRLQEYLGRLVWILIVALLLSGVFVHLLFDSRDERLLGLESRGVPAFLGFTEAGIVLGSVNLLFALFVAIQFRYFFGGAANITATSFTYAEYARRGFGELIIVAFFSLLLFLSLSSVSRRSTPFERRAFSGLGLALVLLLGVMLVSAFQRLLLYEAAYGFTRLRIYTHVCIVWLALLLLALAVLEILRRPRYFALASLLAVLGFGATLNLVNVDALIVNQNARRAAGGEKLDARYLASLSEDSIPALVELYGEAGLTRAERDQIGGALACRKAVIAEQNLPWQSFHLSRWNAARSLDTLESALAAYPVTLWSGVWRVTVEGETRICFVENLRD